MPGIGEPREASPAGVGGLRDQKWDESKGEAWGPLGRASRAAVWESGQVSVSDGGQQNPEQRNDVILSCLAHRLFWNNAFYSWLRGLPVSLHPANSVYWARSWARRVRCRTDDGLITYARLPEIARIIGRKTVKPKHKNPQLFFFWTIRWVSLRRQWLHDSFCPLCDITDTHCMGLFYSFNSLESKV